MQSSSSYWRNNNGGGGGLRRKVVKRKKKECSSSNQMGCEGMVIAPGEVVEVSSNEEGFKGAWYLATILTARSGEGTALVRYHSLLPDDPEKTDLLEENVGYGFIRPRPPQDGDQKAFDEQDIVDAYDKDGWWKGMVSKVRVLEDDSRIYTVLFKNMNPPEESEYLPSCLRPHMDWVDGKWVRPPKAQRMEGLTFGKGMAVEVNVDQGDGEYGWTPATVLGEVVEDHNGIECGFNKMGSEGCMTMDIELPTTTIVDPIAEKHVGIGDGAKEMDYEESATEDVESPKKMQVEHVGKESNSATDFGSCVMEIVGVSKSIRVEHMGSEPIISRCSTREMQFIDCGGTKLDELPVKTSLESAGKDHCRSSGEDTELAEVTGTGTGAGEELIMELPEIPETRTFVEYQMLPFVKESSAIWEVVESLQVFRALPQRPHFRPLTECKEGVREGLAIGYMVTFSLVAEKIQKLRACDSQEMFECHLDSLADLEEHGFDTAPLVHRINELLSIKDKREKLEHQFKKVQSQIVERSQGQSKLENDIDKMNKKLRELQKEQKEKREELRAMELEAFHTEEKISNADEEFENIAAAGW